MSPYFLDLGQALHIHRSVIELYGGKAGVRDICLVQSALAMPQASFDGAWLHKDLYEMAAAYLYHLAQDHPFVDGNKRVAAASAIIFLDLNDISIEADEEGLVELTLRVASSQAGKEEIAAFFRKKTAA